tara:strand:- start:3376 stop:3639 length:264 start_codon:yes stop_codon:yes gene_type:complete
MPKIVITLEDLKVLRKTAANIDAFADLAVEWAERANKRIVELERELEYVRQYGNKDCLAMAYAAMQADAEAEAHDRITAPTRREEEQ